MDEDDLETQLDPEGSIPFLAQAIGANGLSTSHDGRMKARTVRDDLAEDTLPDEEPPGWAEP